MGQCGSPSATAPTPPSSRSPPRCAWRSRTRASSASRSSEGPGGARLQADLGIDAIAHMGHVLVGIEALDRRLRADPTHPLLGSGSLHASVIEGGQVLQLSRTLPAQGRAAHHPGRVDRARRGRAAGAPRRHRRRDPRRRRASAVRDARRRGDRELVSRHAGGPEIVGVPFWAVAPLLGGHPDGRLRPGERGRPRCRGGWTSPASSAASRSTRRSRAALRLTRRAHPCLAPGHGALGRGGALLGARTRERPRCHRLKLSSPSAGLSCLDTRIVVSNMRRTTTSERRPFR